MSQVSRHGVELRMLTESCGGLLERVVIVDPLLCVCVSWLCCMLATLFMVSASPFIVYGGLVTKVKMVK
jgi:hypothetical protein